ncbi:glutamyl-tRNA reductase [Sporolactobacillus shoreicorticis]|uniref:Glutamyl-tRNA reductase n=1 Tax=Sporolactobacillus shoreicorticis TaxID=1923877 RepID=A0ABW5RYN8_9BACL|nr:glutamyl-tRNA reductase [Sporolactobacillus shoreicorticis]MCO7125189.1 glutamyl-tRNA reductase [Sporolactobacillus shoreicorticis]
MHILTIGVNHRNTPVNMREKLTVHPSDLEQALLKLRKAKTIAEDVILSTCNRTELYVVCEQLHDGRYYSTKFFTEWFNIKAEQIAPYLMIKEDQEVVRHLFRVTCGLESMVLGETQILGQVRTGFLAAQHAGTIGTFLNELFQQALNVAKRAQNETQINDHPVSVGYAAVKMLQNAVGSLENRSVLMIGAGDMSRLTLKHLSVIGMGQLTVMNRTKEHAVHLAEQFHGKAATLDELAVRIKQSDIVFTSTSAPEFLLTKADILPLIAARAGRLLILIDVGVPRNIDPQIASLDGVLLYDIDDMDRIVDDSLDERRRAALQIEQFVEQQQMKYTEWLRTLAVIPVISALRKKALSLHAGAMRRIENKLPGMTEQQFKIISRQTEQMINQLLRDPIHNIKELARHDQEIRAVDHFAELFNLTGDGKPSAQTGQSDRVPNPSVEKRATHQPIHSG